MCLWPTAPWTDKARKQRISLQASSDAPLLLLLDNLTQLIKRLSKRRLFHLKKKPSRRVGMQRVRTYSLRIFSLKLARRTRKRKRQIKPKRKRRTLSTRSRPKATLSSRKNQKWYQRPLRVNEDTSTSYSSFKEEEEEVPLKEVQGKNRFSVEVQTRFREAQIQIKRKKRTFQETVGLATIIILH